MNIPSDATRIDFERQNSNVVTSIWLGHWREGSAPEIVGFEEKPIVRSHINAGVYVLSPAALDELEPGAACDMPTLFERVQAKEKKTVAYPMHEPWLDIGRPDDLAKANHTIAPDR